MYLTIGDAQIFTVSFGPHSGPAILGIGGWTGPWELWHEPFGQLSQRWRTLAYDHRGSGASLAPLESITLERLAADVFAVLDHFGVQECVLAAESAGAQTALRAALAQPGRIRGLVLVDALYYAPPEAGETGFEQALRANYPATVAGFVEACLPEPDSEALKTWGRQLLLRAAPEAAVRLSQLNRAADLRPELGRVSQPTLILHGSADAIVPVQAAHWLAQALPNARLKIFEGAGHVPTITRGAAVAREIEAFCAEMLA